MERKPNRSQGEEERDWREMSTIGRIYVSSEVIMYSIADIIEMTGWSEMTVQKLFNDPKFPSANYGKKQRQERLTAKTLILSFLIHVLKMMRTGLSPQMISITEN